MTAFVEEVTRFHECVTLFEGKVASFLRQRPGWKNLSPEAIELEGILRRLSRSLPNVKGLLDQAEAVLRINQEDVDMEEIGGSEGVQGQGQQARGERWTSRNGQGQGLNGGVRGQAAYERFLGLKLKCIDDDVARCVMKRGNANVRPRDPSDTSDSESESNPSLTSSQEGRQLQPWTPHRQAGTLTPGHTKRKVNEVSNSSWAAWESEDEDGVQEVSETERIRQPIGSAQKSRRTQPQPHLSQWPTIKKDSQGQSFRCLFCPFAALKRPAVQHHMGKNHKQKLEENGFKLSNLWLHNCPECGKLFMYASELWSHRVSHMRERPFKCNKCESAFKQKHHLTRHMKTNHGAQDSGRTGGASDKKAAGGRK